MFPRHTRLECFRKIASLDAFPADFCTGPVHLGIGNFDGLHCGHRAIFSYAEKAAEADGGRVGALTFSPHPETFFRGSGAVKLIFSEEKKDELFADAGLDFAVYEPFSADFAKISAEDFPSGLKEKIPTLRGIYVGDNFRFGAGRKGDTELLKKLCEPLGVAVSVVSPVKFDGERVSSSRIRAALAAGEIRAVNAMLAQPYETCGNVVHGNQIGRTIGFPTLNLVWNPECTPRFGVYVVQLSVPAPAGGVLTSKVFYGVANYGVRPTVERTGTPTKPLLETFIPDDFLFGRVPPTYGDFIRVEWLDFLRPEMQFKNLDALKEQLGRDIENFHKASFLA